MKKIKNFVKYNDMIIKKMDKDREIFLRKNPPQPRTRCSGCGREGGRQCAVPRSTCGY